MMERALKERIIGAVVLVVFVVLVVPIFLDGPPDDGEIVSQSVLLPGQEDQKTQTVVLDRDRTEPVPAASQPPTEQTRQEPVREQAASDSPAPVVEQREETPAPVPEPVGEPVSEPVSEPERTAREPAAASTTGMWAVQLGSFSNKENADRLASSLRRQGYAAFISEVSTGSGQMHRVRIGPQKDRPSAEQMAARLAKVGHDGKVVPHP